MIRVIVVDDNAVFRQGMRDLFAAIEDVEVVGVAGDGATGVEAALELQPDIALMDLAMPGMPGIEATRRLTAAAPHIGVVVMTMLEDDDAVVQALRAGARGYLVKGARQKRDPGRRPRRPRRPRGHRRHRRPPALLARDGRRARRSVPEVDRP